MKESVAARRKLPASKSFDGQITVADAFNPIAARVFHGTSTNVYIYVYIPPTAKSPSEAISHDLNVFAWIPTPLFDDEKVVVQRYCSKMNSVFNAGITGIR